jgi:hypothetical protein
MTGDPIYVIVYVEDPYVSAFPIGTYHDKKQAEKELEKARSDPKNSLGASGPHCYRMFKITDSETTLVSGNKT